MTLQSGLSPQFGAGACMCWLASSLSAKSGLLACGTSMCWLRTSTLRLATRESPLALWQTEHVAALLRAAHPGLRVELVPMTTRGDRIIDRPLSDIGGKGLFLKELEIAMRDGVADAAVHSLKDVPMELDGPFAIAAVLERADPFDAFVSNRWASLDALPQGARVGSSSLRRQAQLRALRPDLRIEDLRGNVGTRLHKLDAGRLGDDGLDAILLACAGLQRLGLGERIRERLLAPDMGAGSRAGCDRGRVPRRRRDDSIPARCA